jgi:hypothetical protein
VGRRPGIPPGAAGATCSALDIKTSGNLGTGNISFGCWATENEGASSGEVGDIIGKHDGTYGYVLWLDFGTSLVAYSTAKCQVDGYTTWLPSYTTLLNEQRATNMHHYICTFDDLNHTQAIYVDGTVNKDLGVPGYPALTPLLTSNTADFKIGSGGVKGDFYGYADECFVYKGVLSQRDACRICSCGVDGSLCSCSADNNWASRGRWDSDCGNCTLPTSCLTPPGVD